jgi:hypothetical protein
MKKIVIIAGLLLVALSFAAQRKVLFEEITRVSG